MKNVMIALVLSLSTSAALACAAPGAAGRGGCALPSQGPFDGQMFCRTVETGGMFGQPKGKRAHCLSFANGAATDNANTFFGNPPSRYPYELRENVLVNAGTGDATSYVYENGNLVIAETGAVLVRVR